MSDVVVDVRNVTKTFMHGGSELVALDQANLQIRAGDFSASWGPRARGNLRC